MLVLFPLSVVTVELGQTLISVNESEAEYVACLNKSHSTLRPVKVEVVDIPGTAQRSRGNYLYPLCALNCFLTCSYDHTH